MRSDLHTRRPPTALDAAVETSAFTFIDLFAGLGGFHVALASLGGRAVFAAEWNRPLNALYKSNFGIEPAGDLAQVSAGTIPDHDVLTAGFPCQPFSKAGEQLGFAHTLQGQLFFKVEEIIAAKKPAMFILENVPNILKHQGGETFSVILKSLRNLGYDVDARRYSPHEFGIPQIRDRVYIVGSRSGLHTFKWPQPRPVPTSIRSVLDKNPTAAREIRPNIQSALDIWDDFIRSAPSEVKLPSFPLWAMEFGATYPFEDETPDLLMNELQERGLNRYKGSFGKDLFGLNLDEQIRVLPSHALRKGPRFPKWKIDFIRNNRDFFEQNRSWIEPWLARSGVASLPSSLQKLEWNVQGEHRSLWNYVIQIRASGVRVKRPTTAPSLIAMTDSQTPIIGWERRYMTPRECARLQSLEEIRLPESSAVAYKALGNAVNAEVVRKLAKPLLASRYLSTISVIEPVGSQAASDRKAS
ncbi:DNA (cytosine-5-)-methyltransferase [Rathayibacter sp. AY1D9]|uniref:DNA (cytosine-5-)-methyltransferase n=1 Tax=Rathayibacter sp. AY1D9 TaxID=2080548 RepID=UPI000CE8A620|nr:DNA (cytosine-5-)-methyltransferase [Rathayibacter sp. AY1D9]PPH78154.1 DNA (cytosine-5-)-methyltransferase [Rathayibacter sp. AY1D9]